MVKHQVINLFHSKIQSGGAGQYGLINFLSSECRSTLHNNKKVQAYNKKYNTTMYVF